MPSPAAPSTRAVVTLAIGRVGYWRWTHRIMRRYAARIGADFVVISEIKRNYADELGYRLEKFQLAELLDRYERLIFLDGDILLHPRCPDLFAITPPGRLGVFCEGKYYSRGEVFAEAADFYGVTERYDPREWFNTGMMVISRSHRPLFVPPERIRSFASSRPDGTRSDSNWIDMPLFNAMRLRHGMDIEDLGLRYNYLGSMKAQPNRSFEPEEALIYHGSGPGKALIHRLVKRWYGLMFYYFCHLLDLGRLGRGGV